MHAQDIQKKQPRTVPVNSTAKDQTRTTFSITANSRAADLTAAAYTTSPAPSTIGIVATGAALSEPAPAPPAPVPQAPAEQAPSESASAYVEAPQLEATMRPAADLAALEPAPAEQAPTQGIAAHVAALGQGFNMTNFAAAPEPAVTKGPRADGAAASLAAHELVPVGTEKTIGSDSADLTLAGPAPVVDATAHEAGCGPAPREGAEASDGGVTADMAPTEGSTSIVSDLADQSLAGQAPVMNEIGYEADSEHAPHDHVKSYKGFEATSGVAGAHRATLTSGVFNSIAQVQVTAYHPSACTYDLPFTVMIA